MATPSAGARRRARHAGPGPLHFRRLGREDFALLSRWLSAPHVAPWWREPWDPAALEARYGACIDGRDPTEQFVVERAGTPVAFVQRYRLADEPSWARSLAPAGVPSPAAGIDYLVGEATRTGQGLGTAVIAQFVADLWTRYPEVVATVASVAQPNRRSWRALEHVGFARVWEGDVVSDDPSDEGPSYVYVCRRPADSAHPGPVTPGC